MKFPTIVTALIAVSIAALIAIPAQCAKEEADIHPDLSKMKRSSTGHIVYSKDVATPSQRKELNGDGLLKLYIMTGDGKGQDPFINPDGLVFAAHPSFTSDGKSLVFTSNYKSNISGYYADAFQVRLSDGKYRRLTGDSGDVEDTGKTGSVRGTVVNDSGVTVSGDSDKLIFWKGGEGHLQMQDSGTFTIRDVPAGEIWVRMTADKHVGAIKTVTIKDGEKSEITLKLASGNYLVNSPELGPNGRFVLAQFQQAFINPQDANSRQQSDTMVLFDTKNQGAPIAAWDTEKAGQIRLAKDATLSPNGKYIAFSMGMPPIESIAVCSSQKFGEGNPDETVLVKGSVIPSFVSGGVGNTGPAWSPNGEWIAFTQYVSGVGGFAGNIFAINVKGAGLTQLTRFAQNQCPVNVCWSPDGKYLAFQLITSKGKTLDIKDILKGNITSDIWVIGVNGQGLKQLTRDGMSGDPAWGP